jgi:hypothetical protein
MNIPGRHIKVYYEIVLIASSMYGVGKFNLVFALVEQSAFGVGRTCLHILCRRLVILRIPQGVLTVRCPISLNFGHKLLMIMLCLNFHHFIHGFFVVRIRLHVRCINKYSGGIHKSAPNRF